MMMERKRSLNGENAAPRKPDDLTLYETVAILTLTSMTALSIAELDTRDQECRPMGEVISMLSEHAGDRRLPEWYGDAMAAERAALYDTDSNGLYGRNPYSPLRRLAWRAGRYLHTLAHEARDPETMLAVADYLTEFWNMEDAGEAAVLGGYVATSCACDSPQYNTSENGGEDA